MANIDPAVVLTVISLVLGLLAALKWRRNAADPPLPPGPTGVPLLGYLPFLGKNLHREFAELAETYGPIYKLWLGNKLWVVLTSPSLVKEISRDHDVVFANRDPTVAALTISYGAKDIVFSDHGPYWRKMRKAFVQEMMSNSSLSACYSLRREEVKKSIASLHKKAGSPVDLGQATLSLLIEIIMAMLWGNTVKGKSRESFNLEFRKVATGIMIVIGRTNISDIFPVLARFDLQGVGREAKRLSQWLDNFIGSVISCATKDGIDKDDGAGDDDGKKKDFLQILLGLRMEGEENGSTRSISNQELRAILTDIVVGGTDTTSTSVEWVMARLLHHGPVLQKVVAELTEVVGLDSRVEEFHLPKLTYLDAVIRETLRLHPPLPLIAPRNPSRTVTIGGYTIPKGTKVFINQWAIQRDPQVWKNPLDFKPERFLENSGKIDYYGNNFAYLPFGAGRRICAGITLADKMLKYVIASYLHSFKWELPKGTELEFSDEFGIITKKMNPLIAIPTPRLSKLELYE